MTPIDAVQGIPDIRLLRSTDARVASQMLDLAPYRPVSAMPAVRRDRLGARPGQRNVLVRVVLRHLERTLTDQEANSLRDRIYAAIHQGTSHQWAVAQRPRGRDARAGAGAGRRP